MVEKEWGKVELIKEEKCPNYPALPGWVTCLT